MENAFKIRKGLIVTASGSTAVDIQGNSGQLFSITDSLTGVLMSVNDISGLPILEVSSDDTVKMGTFGAEGLIVSGSSLVFPNVPNAVGDLATITADGTISRRTVSQLLSDMGAQPALTNPVTGTGTTNYLSKFTGTSTLGNSLVFDNGTNVGIGTVTPTAKLQIKSTGSGTGKSFNINNLAGTDVFEVLDNGSTNIKTINTFDPQLTLSSPALSGYVQGQILFQQDTSARGGGAFIHNTQDQAEWFVGRIYNSNKFAIAYKGFEPTHNSVVADGNHNLISILTSGNVGIGTTSPTRKLSVSGTSNSYMNFVASSISKTFTVGVDNSGFIIYDDSIGYRMVINSSGNVGIGTTAPAEKLDVNGNIQAASYKITGATVLQGTSTVTVGSGGSTAAIQLNTTSGVGLILNGGNVGIGTTAPGAKLSVHSAVNSPAIEIVPLTDENSADTSVIRLWGTKFGTANRHSEIRNVTDGSTANNELAFNTNGNERLRITSNGNVGIGTTSPGYKLHVEGSSYLNGNVIVGGDYIYSNGTASYLQFPSSGVLTLGTSGSARLTVTSTGNVGVGTTAPYSKFTTYGLLTAGTSQISIVNGEGGHAIIRAGIGGVTNNGISLITANVDGSNQNTRMVVASDGNVGIGTASPADKLTVDGNLSIFGNKIYNGSASNSAGVSFPSATTRIDGYNGITFHSSTTTVGSQSERMRITSAGNVGIGTTSPVYKLDVNGDGYFNGILNIKSQGVGNSISIIESTSGNLAAYMGESAVGHGFLTLFEKSVGEVIKFDANGNSFINRGNVGIGTTTPLYKLSVSGGIEAGGKVTYTKSAGSLDTIGYDVAGLLPSNNGQSAGFIFTCFGGNGYQKIVYSCKNVDGTWTSSKDIDEGVNALDVIVTPNGPSLTFTFKARTASQNYTPRVTVEAFGAAIDNTYA